MNYDYAWAVFHSNFYFLVMLSFIPWFFFSVIWNVMLENWISDFVFASVHYLWLSESQKKMIGSCHIYSGVAFLLPLQPLWNLLSWVLDLNFNAYWVSRYFINSCSFLYPTCFPNCWVDFSLLSSYVIVN